METAKPTGLPTPQKKKSFSRRLSGGVAAGVKALPSLPKSKSFSKKKAQAAAVAAAPAPTKDVAAPTKDVAQVDALLNQAQVQQEAAATELQKEIEVAKQVEPSPVAELTAADEALAAAVVEAAVANALENVESAPVATSEAAEPIAAPPAADSVDLQTWQATGMAKVAQLEVASQPPRSCLRSRLLILVAFGVLLYALYASLCPEMACLAPTPVVEVAPPPKGFKLPMIKLPKIKLIKLPFK